MVQSGLDQLFEETGDRYAGYRFGYLSNQASINKKLVHGRLLLQAKYGRNLTCLFSPQHGFFGEQQDNMVESAHCSDSATGLPVYSLYSDRRKPTPAMLADLDILLVDLVDVGTRVYTFMYTLFYCMVAAAEQRKKIVVLDRPNPIGGLQLEGNMLQREHQSFVGLFPLPMRHGLTIGELAHYFNEISGLGVELEVVKLKGWNRAMFYDETGLPWVLPSPNMPSLATALVYPGQVIWEGTSASEGRGTTKPFEFCGAPYWQHKEILEFLTKSALPGCLFRPIVFRPTSGKWAGSSCVGFQLHVTDRTTFMPYRTSLALLQAVQQLYPEDFQYKDPPYEYEYEQLPMDLILGDKELRLRLEQGIPIMELEAGWQKDLDEFAALRERFLLY